MRKREDLTTDASSPVRIIHILYTGCAKIKNKFWRQKIYLSTYIRDRW